MWAQGKRQKAPPLYLFIHACIGPYLHRSRGICVHVAKVDHRKLAAFTLTDTTGYVRAPCCNMLQRHRFLLSHGSLRCLSRHTSSLTRAHSQKLRASTVDFIKQSAARKVRARGMRSIALESTTQLCLSRHDTVRECDASSLSAYLLSSTVAASNASKVSFAQEPDL